MADYNGDIPENFNSEDEIRNRPYNQPDYDFGTDELAIDIGLCNPTPRLDSTTKLMKTKPR